MESYKKIINGCGEFLKPIGFKKEGNIFKFEKENNIALIEFQKSRESSKDEVLFTINLGVHINSLFYFGVTERLDNVNLNQCQWKKRIGFILPMNKDYWWTLNSNSNIEKLLDELKNYISVYVLPRFERLITDQLFIRYLEENSENNFNYITNIIYLIKLYLIHNQPIANDTLELFKVSCQKDKQMYFYDQEIEVINEWKKKREAIK